MVTTIIAGFLTPITFFAIFARLWVRFRLQRNAGWDDWLMVIALVLPSSNLGISSTYSLIAICHYLGRSCPIQ